MSKADPQLKSLGTLVDLRERERTRLEADLAARRATQQRFRNNLDRLHRLAEGSGATGGLTPALSLNSANYKQSVLQLADSHRQDLALHEADMLLAQQALHSATRTHQVLDQVLERQRELLARGQASREQKRQDDLASQVWWRGQAAPI